jgi:hypothetical protein
MPEGQFTGERGAYLYTSDAGNQFIIRTDKTLGDLPGTGLVAATTGNAAGAAGLPKRFKPRGVHWQGILNGKTVRKFIICGGGNDATLYVAGGVTALTVDGVTGNTTGHRGEVQSYFSLPAQ